MKKISYYLPFLLLCFAVIFTSCDDEQLEGEFFTTPDGQEITIIANYPPSRYRPYVVTSSSCRLRGKTNIKQSKRYRYDIMCIRSIMFKTHRFFTNGAQGWPMNDRFLTFSEKTGLSNYQLCPMSLKTVDTIGICQRPVFSFGVSHYMHKITNL